MTFNRAVQRYRERAGDSFTWPDYSQSIERAGRWYLQMTGAGPLQSLRRMAGH